MRPPASWARGGARVRILPGPFRDPATRGPLLGWLGVGLALRLLLAPLTVSSDLLAVYWRSHLIAYDGEVFGSYLVNMGAHYLHALWLRVAAPFLPAPDAVWTDPWWWGDSSALATQVQRAFSEAAHAHQTLLVLKLPYIAADLVAGLCLLALIAGCAPRLVSRAWAFWMLSPIGLYATVLFGRYEAFAVALVVAALLAVERERPWLGAVLLGLAITVRGYPLLLLPLFALLAVRGWWRNALWAGLAVLPFAVVMATNRLLAGTVGELARLQDFHTGSTFFSFSLPVEGVGSISIFFAFAFVLYGLVAGRALGWWGPSLAASDLWVVLLVFHAGMFALATFSAHYFMWFTPFVALALARRAHWRATLPLHAAQVVLVLAFVDLVGGPGATLGLFQPLQPQLAGSWPNLRELFLTSGAVEQLAGLLRTAFLAVTALMVLPAFAELHQPVLAEPGDGERHARRDGEEPQPQEARPLGEPRRPVAQHPPGGA